MDGHEPKRSGGRMKILFVNYEYPPLGGGGGLVMASLARQLAQRHEVTVLTSRGPGQPEISAEHGVEVIRSPVFFRRQLAVANLPSMLAFVGSGLIRGSTLLRQRRYDVINTHFVVPTGPVGHLLSRFYGIPNVLSAHGGDLYDPSKRMSPHRHAPLRATVRFLLDNADVLVGQSRDTLRRVREIYGVRRSSELIPLGIEPPVIPAGTGRAAFNLPDSAFLMVTVGRLVSRKNNTLLVRALAASGVTNAHLAIVGTGPEQGEIARTAQQLGVGQRVHLLGGLADAEKFGLLAVADAFFSASQHEGFGLVFLEAMACGLPVVCFDRGGQTDFLRHGKTGRVLALNDLEGLARSIQELAGAPLTRQEMGTFNRNLAERYFIENCAAQYEQVFAAAIDPTFQRTRILPIARMGT